MRASTLESFDAPPALRDDLPVPAPAEGMVEHAFPVVLGRDCAGVVEQVGSGVKRCTAGDEVYGFLPHADPTVHDGTWTALIVVPESAVDALDVSVPAQPRRPRGARPQRRHRRGRP